MHLDVADLRDFYLTALGRVVRRLLAHRIGARWRGMGVDTLIGIGFATPYLGTFRRDCVRFGAFSPVTQGALVWPTANRGQSVLVEPERLPLADNSVDRALLIHCLEMAGRPAPLLRELWRVLAPEGRILIIVPNRRGVWARLDRTPFGQGQPYSRSQLERLLTDSLFTPIDWDSALHVPPFDVRLLLRSARAWERIGARVWPLFGGVILVEAQKQIVQPMGKRAARRALRELVTVRRDLVRPDASTSETRPSRQEDSEGTPNF